MKKILSTLSAGLLGAELLIATSGCGPKGTVIPQRTETLIQKVEKLVDSPKPIDVVFTGRVKGKTFCPKYSDHSLANCSFALETDNSLRTFYAWGESAYRVNSLLEDEDETTVRPDVSVDPGNTAYEEIKPTNPEFYISSRAIVNVNGKPVGGKR
jgi:hypothetical protein